MAQAVQEILTGLPEAVRKRYTAEDARPAPPVTLARRQVPAETVPIAKESEVSMSALTTVEQITKHAAGLVTSGAAPTYREALERIFKADPFTYDVYRAAQLGQPTPVRPALPIGKGESVPECVERLVAARRAVLAKRDQQEDLAESYRQVFLAHEGLHQAYRQAVYA